MDLQQIIDNLLAAEYDEVILIYAMVLLFFISTFTALTLWEEGKYKFFILLPVSLFLLFAHSFINIKNYEEELRNKIKSLNYDKYKCDYLKYTIENKKLSSLNKKVLFETYINKCAGKNNK